MIEMIELVYNYANVDSKKKTLWISHQYGIKLFKWNLDLSGLFTFCSD